MFDLKTFDVKKYDEILDRGLSMGMGDREFSMCIEAAICTVMDLPHGDDPGCVSYTVRFFKINLNDIRWSSNKARADGLRDLGLAQLGSLGIIDDVRFVKELSKRTIKIIIPKLFRFLQLDSSFNNLINLCELTGSYESINQLYNAAAKFAAEAAITAEAAAIAAVAAMFAADAADAAIAAEAAITAAAAAKAAANAAAMYAAAKYAKAAAKAAADAANTAAANAAKFAANAAKFAADAAEAAAKAAVTAAVAGYVVGYVADVESDSYLILSANIALEILKEMGSPGCSLLYKDTA